ncbi:MAG: ParB/RepB/Spo0J family partition protein [Chloroflexota bacterium]|nr:ParB/RepB/Spo0J family partition protein [Chloroflexota bacterium]
MAGSDSNKRRFSVARRPAGERTTDDFSVVLTGDFVNRQTVPMDIPIDQIDPSPFQIRRTFENIGELAEAMRLHGFTSRLMVRQHPAAPDRYQLVFGERRLRAARLAGIEFVPCDVTQFDDRELLEIGLTENLQREDLDPLEEAQGLRRFMDEFGYTVRDMAERTGKSRGYIDNRLGLLRAPDDVQQMVSVRPDTVASVPVIAKLLTPEARRPLIEGLTKGNLTAADVRTIVRESQESSALMPSSARPAGSARGDTSSAEQNHKQRDTGTRRGIRQSERALQRARHTLDAMTGQLQEVLSILAPEQSTELLDYIVRAHFPRLELIVEELRRKQR